MNSDSIERVVDRLWADSKGLDKPQVYAVLDTARYSKLALMIRLSGLDYECIFRGRLNASIRNAAPYVVNLGRNARFTSELIEQGWGKSWGFFTRVPPNVSLKQHYRHLLSLLRVQDESGRTLLFRYYDPRVLRVYLPTCTDDEIEQFFGPVREIVTESENPEQMRIYARGPRGLKTVEYATRQPEC